MAGSTNLKMTIGIAPRKHSKKSKDTTVKSLRKFVASDEGKIKIGKGLASMAWNVVNTTFIQTEGARNNDITRQNQIDNMVTNAGRFMRWGKASMAGGAMAGPFGAVAGLVVGIASDVVGAYQSNVDWRLNNMENQLKSAIALEQLGVTKTDMNRR